MTFQTFEVELSRLVASFERQLAAVMEPSYSEARLRQDYLDPLFRALGWDLENSAGLLQHEREVEIESRTDIAGRAKRADYLFRTDARDQFTCEAKKPRDPLGDAAAFQAKRYSWNKSLGLALLSDFEELKIYVVGGKPQLDEPAMGLWRSWHFREFPSKAGDLWKLLAREQVAAGSIPALLDTLPKRPAPGRGKSRQLYVVKPDRTRALDTDFLNLLDEARQELASDLLKHNVRAEILEDTRLNEAVQSILDRLLFIRICEDRDIDTGVRLQEIVERWRRSWAPEDGKQKKDRKKSAGTPDLGGSLWTAVVRHIRALDRRPPSHIPFFNGNLFKPHLSEELVVGDTWLAEFIAKLSADESPYLFNVIPVEILGSVYECFLGKIVRPHGRGVTIENKPEVRKAGGVYYTPRYIVNYIVEETLGCQLNAVYKSKTLATFGKNTRALRVIDPACGSGSFLIRAFERVCEHWQRRFTSHPSEQKKDLCWVDPVTKDVHLTVDLKRHIMRDNIYGVDIDAQAVEVTQLSLYLKMLEGENRTTLFRQRELFGSDVPLLPPLENNIKCGNSLIGPDFSLIPDDLVRVNAFDWQIGFPEIMKDGGFDAVVGNPPWLYSAGKDTIAYFNERYEFSEYQTDYYTYFVERALSLTKAQRFFSFVVSDSWLKAESLSKLRTHLLTEHRIVRLAMFTFPPFEGATIESSILALEKNGTPSMIPMDLFSAPGVSTKVNDIDPATAARRGMIDPKQSDAADALIARLEAGAQPLAEFAEINRGIHAYRTDGYGKSKYAAGYQTKKDKDAQSYHSTERLDATYLPELKGKDVFRFEFVPSGNYVSYGPWLAEPREPKYFKNPKLAIRKVLGKKLHGTYLPEAAALDQSLYVLISPQNDVRRLKYLLGILLSSVGAWYLRTKYAIYDTLYPWYTRKQLAAFPIRGDDDRLVALVDKMLALVSKLREEAWERGRGVLENAVASTNQKLDNLVYDLYGLKPNERAAIEKATS